jgi:hypothetical protein
MRSAFLLLIAMLTVPSAAMACPFCDSATAEQVRSLAFGPDFAAQLAAVLAPAPVLLACVAAGGRLGAWLAATGRSDG